MASIRFHLANLFRFAGRESCSFFWIYAGCVFGASFLAMFAVMVPMFSSTFARMQQFAVAHPDKATITQGPGSYSIQIQGYHPELFPDLRPVMGAFCLIVAIVVLLLAAAVARRLHDRDKSGFWGLMPLPFLATGFALMPRMFDAPEPDMTLFGYLFLNNAIYIGLLVFLIILLAGRSEPGENRYGPVPSP